MVIKNHSGTIKYCSVRARVGAENCSLAAKGVSMRVVVIKNHRGAINDPSVRARAEAKNFSLTAKLVGVIENHSLMATHHLRNAMHHLRNGENVTIIFFKNMGLVL